MQNERLKRVSETRRVKPVRALMLLQVWNKAICEWFTIFSLWGIYHG